MFGLTLKTKYKNLVIISIFSPHIWRMKTSKITSFFNFGFCISPIKKKRLIWSGRQPREMDANFANVGP